MNQVKYIFSQDIEFLNRSKFNRIVAKCNGDKYVKHYTCWNQLLTLIFGQLSGAATLRDVVIVFLAHNEKLYHLGIGTHLSRSNLSKANEQRDYHIFEAFAYYMIGQARHKRTSKMFDFEGNVYAFDSTTIDLCLALFKCATFRKKKDGIKVHSLFDVQAGVPIFAYITEAKVHDMNAMDEIPYETGSYYIFDRGYNDYTRLYVIHKLGATFTGYYQQQDHPEPLRLIRYWDEENRREFIFLTNNFDLTSLEVAELYRNRWQIELFFKWLKQHLKIKHFYGTSLSAVKIQVYVAIIIFYLVVIVQYDMKLTLSTYEVLQVFSVSLTAKSTCVTCLTKLIFKMTKNTLI